MFSRFITRPSYLRFLTQISSNPSLSSPPNLNLPQSPNPNSRFLREPSRALSSNRKNNNGGDDSSRDPSTSRSWSFSPGNESGDEDSIFGSEEGSISGIVDPVDEVGDQKTRVVGSDGDDDLWSKGGLEKGDDIFEEIDKQFGSKKGGGDDEWKTAEGYKPWSFGDDEEKDDVFEIGKGVEGIASDGNEGLEMVKEIEKEEREGYEEIEKEEQELLATLKGPNRAFGDLITASGITESMLDSLILLKDLEGVEGLPPLTEIEDMRLAKNEMKSSRAEIERQKQEEIAKARVRQVDEKGRAYGTGRRKCSIARVWIQPGDGKFIVNDKQFDVYFPILDHRADLLRPFAETKTLGLWDVTCTVKGGGVSGQVGAIRLGISKALQNWEPGLRPYLRAEGFLTRDSRVVERKKPGKAKARKSFQWVKR